MATVALHVASWVTQSAVRLQHRQDMYSEVGAACMPLTAYMVTNSSRWMMAAMATCRAWSNGFRSCKGAAAEWMLGCKVTETAVL